MAGVVEWVMRVPDLHFAVHCFLMLSLLSCLEPNSQPMQKTYREGLVAPTYLGHIRISMQKL